ncbi:MAG: MerR family DNA-binding protein [Planctomycetota bacterium]
MKTLTRSEAARRAQVHGETLRYYEKRGLLPRPSRSASNYRLYSEDAVRRIRFVKRAQELGFSLEEIKDLLSLRARPGPSCERVRKKATAKIREVEEKIQALQTIRDALSHLVTRCSSRGATTECPILDAMEPKA